MNDEGLFAPADVVPVGGLTEETLRALDAAAGDVVTVHTPGEVVLDVDGMPIAVGAAVESTAVMAGIVLSRADAERLGIDTGALKHTRIVDDPID